MALVALIFLFPWLGAALLPCLRPLLGRHLGRMALVPPAVGLLITLIIVTSTSYDQEVRYTLPWFPELGVNFSLWIDGLSVFFALFVAAMGRLIAWYSNYFLGGPVGAPMIARTAYRSQVPVHERTIVTETNGCH